MTNERGQFSPDYAVPPGATLQEKLEFLGMTQAELAERMGRPKKTINEIIKGKAAITPETAVQLERVLNVPARIWIALEQNYRAALVRKQELDSLVGKTDLLDKVPWVDMDRYGWLPEFTNTPELIDSILRFFGVANPESWQQVFEVPQASYRKSPKFNSDPGALAAWLRKGELIGQQTACHPFDREGFKSCLREVRALSTAPTKEFQTRIPALCSEFGVVVAFVPELPGCRASGAARWMTPDKALIQVSLRYKSDDHLWFTLFHEAGHVLLHGKRDVFVDVDDSDGTKEEEEANKFAADFLIPPEALDQFLRQGRPTAFSISRFAHQLGIAPGIVVGRLQHDKIIGYNQHNHLKRRFTWNSADS